MDQLGWAQRFTQLDLTNAYYQIKIREGNEWKMAFKTHYGHFEYQVIPFALTNTPAMFQDYINKILAEKPNLFVIIYVHDILIYTKCKAKEHMEAFQ